ncbi:hypothetical protein V8E53_004421 [Lactarius tabidus]
MPAKSSPVQGRFEKYGEDPPPLPSQRHKAKSAAAPARRVTGAVFVAPSSWNPHLPMSAEHSRAMPRRPRMSYPARRPLSSTVQQALPEGFKFRILVVGKRHSGKSSLIKTVFKVDVTAAPENPSISAEFRPDDNRYLIVHEFSGLYSQTSDSPDLKIIRDFVSRRTDPTCLPSERLHVIWICVPASDAIDGRLGDGVEDILGLRNVPVVLVFTKFDVLVSQLLLGQVLNSPSDERQSFECAWARAGESCDDSCRRLLHKDPGDVPAEIVSENRAFTNLITNLVATTDRLITASRTPSARSIGQMARSRVDAVPLAWSAALRVNHDIIIQSSIEVGRARYWRSLWSSLDFADQTLGNCVNIIHLDIVEIWNLNDKNSYLSSNKFKAKMSHLIKDLVGSANATSSFDRTRAPDDYADWVHDCYRGSMENVRCVVGYIVDLTVILDDIFRMSAGDLLPKDVHKAFERHITSGYRDAIHRDIRSFVSEAFAIRFCVPQRDIMLERIIDWIKQFCVPH